MYTSSTYLYVFNDTYLAFPQRPNTYKNIINVEITFHTNKLLHTWSSSVDMLSSYSF